MDSVGLFSSEEHKGSICRCLCTEVERCCLASGDEMRGDMNLELTSLTLGRLRDGGGGGGGGGGETTAAPSIVVVDLSATNLFIFAEAN